MAKTEAEKAAVGAIRIYAYEHAIPIKDEPSMFPLNLKALHSLFNATKVIESSSIFSCPGLFGEIRVFCINEILRLKRIRQGNTRTKQLETYYTILNIEESATPEEIKEAYRLLVLKYHPDVNKDENATEKFLKIKRVYDCLSNNLSRRIYDKNLQEARRSQGEYRPYTTNQNTSNAQYTTSQTSASSSSSQDARLRKESLGVWKKFFGMIAIFTVIASIGLINEKCEDNSIEEKSSKRLAINESSDDSIATEVVENTGGYCYKVGSLIYDISEEQKEGFERYYPHAIQLFVTGTGKRYRVPLAKRDKFLKEFPDAKPWRYPKKKGDVEMGTQTPSLSSGSVDTQYTETRFSTGDMPYGSYYGVGKFDGSSLSELKILNYSSSDAVVLLEDKYFGVIRNVFVREGHIYTMDRIPEGRCRIRVMYGNSWNAEKDNGPGLPKGGFMRNTSYSQSAWSDSFDFYSERTADGINYPTYSVTLHKVINGNMETESIDKDEFWRN